MAASKTHVQTIPKQVRGIQLQPREQVVEVLIVLHFEQLVENPVLIAETVVQVPRGCTVRSTKNVPQVMEEIGKVVRSFPRAHPEAYHRLNRRCTSDDATPSTDHPDSSEDSGGSTSAIP